MQLRAALTAAVVAALAVGSACGKALEVTDRPTDAGPEASVSANPPVPEASSPEAAPGVAPEASVICPGTTVFFGSSFGFRDFAGCCAANGHCGLDLHSFKAEPPCQELGMPGVPDLATCGGPDVLNPCCRADGTCGFSFGPIWPDSGCYQVARNGSPIPCNAVAGPKEPPASVDAAPCSPDTCPQYNTYYGERAIVGACCTAEGRCGAPFQELGAVPACQEYGVKGVDDPTCEDALWNDPCCRIDGTCGTFAKSADNGYGCLQITENGAPVACDFAAAQPKPLLCGPPSR